MTFISETTQSVNISITDDDLVEHPEVIQLNLTTLTSESHVVQILGTNLVQIEITDDDCV